MDRQMFRRFGLVLLAVATVLVIGGCGGGGGSTAPAPAAKATISGAVTFPSIGSLVAKRVGKVVTDNTVTVQAYTLDGKPAGNPVNPTYDDEAATRVYAYSITNLEPGVDYVIKVTRGSAVLKKLIEKKDVVSGVLPGQNLDGVSTTAVIIASQKLGFTVGDTLPTGKTVADTSSKISADIKPVLLEGTISSVINGSSSTLTASTVEYANLFNVVVSAIDDNKDPVAVIATPTLISVSIFTADVNGVISTTTFTSVEDITPTYTAPTESAATYTTMAKSYLAVQDISNAAINYEKALAIDATDPEANFGGAITSGMMLMEDTDVQAIVTKWGAVVPTVNQVVQGTSPIKLPFSNLTSIKLTTKTTAKSVASATSATTTQNVLAAFSALKVKLPQQKTGFKSLAKELGLVATTVPTIGEMQTLIDNVIIPKIDKINARLAKAETPTFTFTVTKEMQGNPYGTDVILNSGELYTLDAALNIFQVLFKIASSYNFDLPSGFTYDTIGQDPLAMINSATVFTLKATGSAKMLTALDNAKTAAAKALLAYNRVSTRAAGVGMFDLASWTALEKTDFTAGLAKVTAVLAGPYALPIDNGTRTVNIDATKFFTNPLTRSKLPTFGYDVPRNATLSTTYNSAVAGTGTYTDYNSNTVTYPIHCEIVPMSDLPDYTLNGILPGNSATTNIAQFNGILPVISGKLLSESVDNFQYSYYVTDGAYIYYLKHGTYDPATYSYQYLIKKIDPATGTITTHLTITSTVWAESLFYFNGTFYLVQYNDAFYPISGTTVATAPALTLSSSTGMISAFATSSTDIYYVLKKWDMITYTYTSEIHKVTPTTTSFTDVILFTVADEVDKIAYANGSIYVNPNDTYKISPDGTLVATYLTGGGDWDIFVGGYFYNIYDGKIVKSAGTPTGGTAKAALAKYFGF